MKKLIMTNLLAALVLTSCTDTGTVSSSSGQSATVTVTDTSGSTGSNGSGSGSGSTGSGSTTPGAGSTCYGSSSDGQGNGVPIHYFNLRMAGHQAWAPGTHQTSITPSGTLYKPPTLQDSVYLFQSDSRLRVRFKINPQPYTNPGEDYCYGRVGGQATDKERYTKLRFQVTLRDIECSNPDPSNTNGCLTAFTLGAPYALHEFSPQAVDSCTPIVDFGPLRNQTQFGSVVQVDVVRSDSTCLDSGTKCPAEDIVRAASCWDMKMQVVTDGTQDFK